MLMSVMNWLEEIDSIMHKVGTVDSREGKGTVRNGEWIDVYMGERKGGNEREKRFQGIQ